MRLEIPRLDVIRAKFDLWDLHHRGCLGTKQWITAS